MTDCEGYVRLRQLFGARFVDAGVGQVIRFDEAGHPVAAGHGAGVLPVRK